MNIPIRVSEIFSIEDAIALKQDLIAFESEMELFS